jgi:putative polyhydroxyalkanoate system protein
MADIHIHRDHRLGLPKARKIAWKWAEEVEAKFDMACTVIEGETSDTVEFTRSGVSGTLVVAATHFDLNAKLGFLLGAFSKTIESEIEKNLDALLRKSGAGAAGQAASAKPTIPAIPTVPTVPKTSRAPRVPKVPKA